MTGIDPLSAECPHCLQPPGERCRRPDGSGPYYRTHKARERDAFVVAAHADPALDEWFPRRGQCLVCDTRGLDARHRTVDAIAGHLAAGDALEDVAAEFDLDEGAVRAVEAWAAKWPGAWQ